MFSQQKLLVIVFIVLRYPIDKDSQEFNKLESYMLRDQLACPQCFKNQSTLCQKVNVEYEFNEDFVKNLNNLFGVRHIRSLREKHNSRQRMLAKYLARDIDLSFIQQLPADTKLAREILSEQFFNESRLDGMQFCPQSEVQRFVKLFSRNHTELSIWIHMNVDMQPILLPYLHALGFPVPRTFFSCGFTTFQSEDGTPLSKWIDSDFEVKLRIASQLIEGALRFTDGFEDFRIYITDLEIDNIVYDPQLNRLSFVDLDTVLIVDGRRFMGSVHRHDFIECDGCFAYSPKDICSHDKSDINVFAVCQLLMEDLSKDRTKGFLSPVPKGYKELWQLLNECVDCPQKTCADRFHVARKIVDSIRKELDKTVS